MPSARFMVSVPGGPENLERLGVHLLPFQVERPLERLPDFPSEITVPSAWNGRNGNIVPFQFFFYVESLERRADMQAARCTASTLNAGFAAAPPMKPPPMPPAATRKPHKRFSGAGRGEVAATIPRRLRAVLRRLRASAGRGRRNANGKRQPLNWRLVSDVGEVSDRPSLSF